MSLSDFIRAEKNDPNAFWRLASGDHQNLLAEALELLEKTHRAHSECDCETCCEVDDCLHPIGAVQHSGTDEQVQKPGSTEPGGLGGGRQ